MMRDLYIKKFSIVGRKPHVNDLEDLGFSLVLPLETPIGRAKMADFFTYLKMGASIELS
jgi:hypothetical protein